MIEHPSFEGSRILLCVTGGVAAYKVAGLTSTLVQRGAIVDVAMTAAAEQFVTPLTFSALTARPVYGSLWDAPERVPHIRLVREARVALVAPATADIIAKLACGIADDLVSTALLAARIPVLLAPSMNDAMYRNAATQSNLQTLRDRGYTIVEPETGFLAERESGIGRLAPEEALLDSLEITLRRTGSLAGKRIAITAGPTREAFDPVRFVSNPSSGETGIALAREAALRGADVTLLLGPIVANHLPNVRTIRIESAQEMYEAAKEHAAGADVVIASAAISDWRPAEQAKQKVKKSDGELTVRFERTPDIVEMLSQRKGSGFVMGFAAETEAHENNAREKLRRKHLDAIAVNDVSNGRGFGLQNNLLTVLWGTEGRRELGEARKDVLAARLLDCIEELMVDRAPDH